MHVGGVEAEGHAAFALAAAHVTVSEPERVKPEPHENVATLLCKSPFEKSTLPSAGAEGKEEHSVATHPHTYTA